MQETIIVEVKVHIEQLEGIKYLFGILICVYLYNNLINIYNDRGNRNYTGKL
jgi:hypothetical protein